MSTVGESSGATRPPYNCEYRGKKNLPLPPSSPNCTNVEHRSLEKICVNPEKLCSLERAHTPASYHLLAGRLPGKQSSCCQGRADTV